MTGALDRAVDVASTMALQQGENSRRVARAIQDAALGAVDPRAAQRIALIDREFDQAVSRLDRERSAAVTAAPRVRRFSPGPEILAMLTGGFGAASAVGAGRVVSRTPAGELPVVGPTVLVATSVALVALLVGVIVTRREAANTQARAVLLWLTAVWAVVAAIGVSVRLATEGVTVPGTAAVVVAAVLAVVSLVLAIGAQRNSAGRSAEPAPRAQVGAREWNEMLSASETAQDRAAEELESLDDGRRREFEAAYAGGVAAVVARRVLSSGETQRLRSEGWAAARYSLSG